jgi:hypothetical protein
MLLTLNDEGRAAVQTALRMFNAYGEQIGAKPSFGKEPKASGSGSSGGFTMRPPNLQDVRRMAASF